MEDGRPWKSSPRSPRSGRREGQGRHPGPVSFYPQRLGICLYGMTPPKVYNRPDYVVGGHWAHWQLVWRMTKGGGAHWQLVWRMTKGAHWQLVWRMTKGGTLTAGLKDDWAHWQLVWRMTKGGRTDSWSEGWLRGRTDSWSEGWLRGRTLTAGLKDD